MAHEKISEIGGVVASARQQHNVVVRRPAARKGHYPHNPHRGPRQGQREIEKLTKQPDAVEFAAVEQVLRDTVERARDQKHRGARNTHPRDEIGRSGGNVIAEQAAL